jgi:membrane protease YdiL (CAAX protease family)
MISHKPWKLESVLRLTIGIFASISVGVLLVQIILVLWGENSTVPHMATFIVGTLSFHGAGLLFIHLFLREHQAPWSSLVDWRKFGAGRLWLYAFGTLILFLPVSWLMSQASGLILEQFRVPPRLQTSVELLQKTRSIPQLVYFGLVAVLLAPLVEEILFRGILYPVVKQQGHRYLALVGTSVLFAATHANFMAFLPLMVLAMILVALYEFTDNLAAPMMTHSLFNLMNFLYVIWQGGSPG